PRADHRVGRKDLAQYAPDHGLGRRGPGPGGRLRPRDPAVHRSRTGRCGRRNVREARDRPRRDRPAVLPSRRGQGDRRDRDRARTEPGRAQPRARSVARLWQYERADGDVRARAAARAGPAGQGANDCFRTWLHLRRAAARSRVTLNLLILALVTLQRLGELWLANRNTRRLLSQGAREHAPGHYPLIVAVHGLWLATLWWFGLDRPLDIFWLAMFVIVEIARIWVLASLGPRWTTRIIVLPEAP